METKKEVKTIQVDYECPKCKTGRLRHTGNVLTTYPAQFPHMCNTPGCDYGETFMGKTYPYVIYEEVSNKEPML